MKSKKIFRVAALAAAGVAGAWLFAVVLLPVLLPFLVGLSVAALVEKPVLALMRRLRMRRGVAAFLCVLAVYAALGAGLFFLCRTLFSELMGFVRRLPELAGTLSEPLARLESRLLELAGKLPDGIGSGLRSGIRSLFESGSVLGAKLYERLFSFASGFLGRLPKLAFFLVTAILASFMSAAELPALRAFAQKRLPAPWREKLAALFTHFKATLGVWLRAQLKLMGIIFLLVTAGLMLFGVDYPLLFGLVIALVDALPVFGTGTILIPWSLAHFARGNLRCGAGFLILYGAATLTRQTLEPRFVGKQAGVPPLLTLLAMYAGFRTVGVAGMLLFPLGVLFAKQLLDHANLKRED